MAGAIVVSEHNGLSLNSVDFDYIAERIRRNFPKGYQELSDDIFSPMDEGGLSFISLIECNDRAIAVFQEAVEAAYKEELEERSDLSRLSSLQQLISLLHARHKF